MINYKRNKIEKYQGVYSFFYIIPSLSIQVLFQKNSPLNVLSTQCLAVMGVPIALISINKQFVSVLPTGVCP